MREVTKCIVHVINQQQPPPPIERVFASYAKRFCLLPPSNAPTKWLANPFPTSYRWFSNLNARCFVSLLPTYVYARMYVCICRPCSESRWIWIGWLWASRKRTNSSFKDAALHSANGLNGYNVNVHWKKKIVIGNPWYETKTHRWPGSHNVELTAFPRLLRYTGIL